MAHEFQVGDRVRAPKYEKVGWSGLIVVEIVNSIYLCSCGSQGGQVGGFNVSDLERDFPLNSLKHIGLEN